MKDRPWLSLVDAVRAIREARGVSGGAACTLLCQACESGVVRSCKRPWPEQRDEPPEPIYDHWRPPISKLDWHGASIDLEHGWLILAGDKLLLADVEINADDLCIWLIQRDAEKIEPEAAPKRAASTRNRGPRPFKLEATKRAIGDDLVAGRHTQTQLRDMKEVALAKTYGVSRDTARKALAAVLSGFIGNSMTDK